MGFMSDFKWVYMAFFLLTIGTMPRRPRTYFPGGTYHIYFRGNQKQKTFLCAEDYEKYLDLMKKNSLEEESRVHAYYIMPNHGHIIARQVSENPIHRFMHRVQSNYAQYWNRKYGKVGHVFQGRYKAIICLEEAYLLELIRYIHLNSVRAGLVAKPEDHIWSSHLDYLSKGGNGFIDKDLILSYFGDDLDKFAEFVANGIEGDNSQYGHISLAIERAVRRGIDHPSPTLPEVIQLVSREFGVELGSVISYRKILGPILSRFICVAQKYGYSLPDIADYLGCSRSTIIRKKSGGIHIKLDPERLI